MTENLGAKAYDFENLLVVLLCVQYFLFTGICSAEQFTIVRVQIHLLKFLNSSITGICLMIIFFLHRFNRYEVGGLQYLFLRKEIISPYNEKCTVKTRNQYLFYIQAINWTYRF